MRILFLFLIVILVAIATATEITTTTTTTTQECDTHCQIQQFLKRQCKDDYVGERLSRDVHEATTLRSVYNSLLQNGKHTTQELKEAATKAKNSKFVQETLPTFVKSHTLGCSGTSCTLPEEKATQKRSVSLSSSIPKNMIPTPKHNSVNQLQSLLLQNEQRAVMDVDTKQQLVRQCLRRIDKLASGIASILKVK